MQDGQCRIHVREEKVDALLDDVVRQESRRRSERGRAWRTMEAAHSTVNLARERALSLRLPQLADDLRSGALRALLLWNGVVGAGQLGRGAIATRIQAVALHFSSVARVAGSLYGRRGRRDGCRRRRCWRRRRHGEGVDDDVLDSSLARRSRMDGATKARQDKGRSRVAIY
jgi:hypothetical protein